MEYLNLCYHSGRYHCIQNSTSGKAFAFYANQSCY